MNAINDLPRRGFLSVSAAAGAFTLGIRAPLAQPAAATPGAAPAGAAPEVNAWVVVKPDDTIVIRVARSEMGQGTLTGLAQLVAEELNADWSKVDRVPDAGAEPGAQSRLGEHVDRRQPRHP